MAYPWSEPVRRQYTFTDLLSCLCVCAHVHVWCRATSSVGLKLRKNSVHFWQAWTVSGIHCMCGMRFVEAICFVVIYDCHEGSGPPSTCCTLSLLPGWLRLGPAQACFEASPPLAFWTSAGQPERERRKIADSPRLMIRMQMWMVRKNWQYSRKHQREREHISLRGTLSNVHHHE